VQRVDTELGWWQQVAGDDQFWGPAFVNLRVDNGIFIGIFIGILTQFASISLGEKW
jgi:hypothetical protein